MKNVLLNGQWNMCWAPVGTWDVAQAGKELDRGGTLCPVPGGVHQGLLAAGVIPEPLEGKNTELCRFVEQQDFWLRTTVFADQELLQGSTTLVFDGLDLDADIYFNGKHVAHSNNAFLRVEVDVTALLWAGNNDVTVRLNEGLAAVRHKPVDYMKYSWNRDEPHRTWLRKPQYCYGWDWCKRLSTCGIYQNVWLKNRQKATLEDVRLQSLITQEGSEAQLVLQPEISGWQGEGLTLACRVYTDGRFEQERCVATLEVSGQEQAVTITVPNSRFWWAVGSGDPYLYRVEVDLTEEGGRVLDSFSADYGLRTLVWDQSPIDVENKHFTLTMNDRPVFAKGANWVPIDQVAGRASPEKYKSLVRSAADMNMNMLRVWGGGLYETEDFFNFCDQYGIMVWHDFMFACGFYPDFDAEFMESVQAEAEYQVKRLRSRTCFVGWSGNNENQAMFDSLKDHMGENAVFYGEKIYNQLLPAVCHKLDPEREYRHSSPFGGAYPDSPFEGDQHVWAYNQDVNPQYMDLFRYTETPCKFLSEFGVLGPMNLESLERCVEEGQRFPLSEQWLYHSNTGDYFDKVLAVFFGIREASKLLPLPHYILMGQAIQAECIRFVFQEYRARAFTCSGTLLWMFSDCYPTSGWTFVDYYLNKKPLYYYTKRAFAPLAVTFRGYQPQLLENHETYGEYYQDTPPSVEIWASSDAPDPVDAVLETTLMTLEGKCLAYRETAYRLVPGSQHIESCGLVDVLANNKPEELVLHCRLVDKQGRVAENRYFLVPFQKLALAPAEVKVEIRHGEGFLEAVLQADRYIWLLHIRQPDGTTLSDNDFDLLPGRAKIIRIYGDMTVDRLEITTMNQTRLWKE